MDFSTLVTLVYDTEDGNVVRYRKTLTGTTILRLIEMMDEEAVD